MLNKNGVIKAKPLTVQGSGRFSDGAISSGQAALVSELEKRDPLLREPMTSVTYPRDVPIEVGGGWVDSISAMQVNYGLDGGSRNGPVVAGGANSPKVIQANFDQNRYKTHIFNIDMIVNYVDLQRSLITGRNLDNVYTDGIRLAYDKHNDAGVYLGFTQIGTTGLINNPNVETSLVAMGAAGGTAWRGKTPDEILQDFNDAIITNWARAEYDQSALPNHALIPYEQYNYLATTKVSAIAEKTILNFLLENNVVKHNGGELYIGPTQFNSGAGVGGTDRMVVYVNNERFLKFEELVSLYRAMTETSAQLKGYISTYYANLSEVQFHYTETFGYYDGI